MWWTLALTIYFAIGIVIFLLSIKGAYKKGVGYILFLVSFYLVLWPIGIAAVVIFTDEPENNQK